VLPLAGAVERLRHGSLAPRSVAITFDDGYANNLHLAYPLLQKYQLPATIFLSSSYIESGEFLPFLKLKLIRLCRAAGTEGDALPEYKPNPIDIFSGALESLWSEMKGRLTTDQNESLRPLTIGELDRMDSGLVEFGGHCHTHCILRNETRERRQQEVRISVRKVAEWTGRPARVFSYPNGEAGDFDQLDQDVLREERIEAAVSGIAGSNGQDADPLALKRYPLGLFHDGFGFRAEITGLRTTWRSIVGGHA
jgi:peptidoglycan/xylan/chitin deacetylase (PgdA/CDA1 family)